MTGKELKEFRLKQGLTMEALAEKIGCPFQTLWRWEHERNPISPVYQRIIKSVKQEMNNHTL